MMKEPCHPGEILAGSFGKEGLNIPLAEAARHLGISHVTLSRVVNCRAAISTDLAVRLEFAGLSTERLWLAMQAAYDISRAKQREQPRVERFEFERAA
jgi:antitoxin HigA-1